MKEKEYKIPGGNVTYIPADPKQQAELEREREMIEATSGIAWHMNKINKLQRARELRAQIQEQEIVIQFSKDRISALEDELREIENG